MKYWLSYHRQFSAQWKTENVSLQLLMHCMMTTAHRVALCMFERANGAEWKMPERPVFTEETVFHVSGRLNMQSAVVWDTENPHVMYELERASLKVNVSV
jgi:hypothetical protein